MYEDSTVGVVVPAYNEEGFVGRVIETVPTFVDRIYVVDDCSTDDTWAEIERHAALVNGNADADGAIPYAPVSGGAVTDGGLTFSRRVVPIRHERNRGVGGAIVTGYRRARAEGIDVTAVMAGDGQMDPDRLARLIDPIVDGSADYAKGSRLLARDHSAAMSSWRLFGNRLLTVLTKVASGYWRTTDPQNGYTAISHRALSTLELSALYEDYGFLNDLLIRLNAHGMRVADVAMPAVYGDERSTITYSQFVLGLSAVLLRGFLWRLKTRYVVRGFHPLVVLYALGALGVGGGSLNAVRSLLSADDSDSEAPRTGIAMLTVFVTCASFLLALIFDVGESKALETRRYR
jgi:glycosyltransferase involved in cell wall biosynthesis